jgi:IS605 OrfB family transposase
VIKFCQQQGCGKIHMEDLTELRQSDMDSEYKRLIWVPSKFYNLLEYKAKETGIEILKINPRNTSRRCSECGHIAKENRKSQSAFLCVKCGHKANADYNAARNIALATKEVMEKGYTEDVPDLREEP